MRRDPTRDGERSDSILAAYACLEFDGMPRPEELFANPDTAGVPSEGLRAAGVELGADADRFLSEITLAFSY